MTGLRHRYLVSQSKNRKLWRLVEKTSDTAAVEIFYYTATSCYLSLHLKKELDAWMCLCVNVSSEKKEKLFICSHFLQVLMLPPSSSQSQTRVYYEVWISQLFLFKRKFSSIWKEGLASISTKSTWVHFKTLSDNIQSNSKSRSCILAFGDSEGSKDIFLFHIQLCLLKVLYVQ